jgi:hypothetical protein
MLYNPEHKLRTGKLSIGNTVFFTESTVLSVSTLD